MATTIYKFEPIDLHKGYFAPSDWDLVGAFLPDQLVIYVGVCDLSDAIDWSNTNSYTEIEGDVLEVGSLRQGFDEDNNSFTFDDISFKVLNDSGVWDNILSMTTKAEIRMIYARQTGDLLHPIDATPIFYGVISKKDISHSNDVDPNDAKWGKYREYDFTAIDNLSKLKEVPISYLKDALASNRTSDDYYEYKLWLNNTESIDIHILEQTPHAAVHYIGIKKLVKSLLELIFTDTVNIVIVSDISFANQSVSEVTWYIDSAKTAEENVMFLFRRMKEDGSPDYTGTFFDEADTCIHSFFKFANGMELFKNILNNFGLIWRASYVSDETYDYKFSMTINFSPRRAGTLINSIDDEILENPQGKLQMEEVEGCAVSVANYGDVTSYKMIRYANVDDYAKQEIPYSDSLLKRVTQFTSAHYRRIQSSEWNAVQCFFGYRSDKIYYMDKYSVNYGNSDIEIYQVTLTDEDWANARHCMIFGKMLANYYGGLYGMFSVPRETLSITIDTLFGQIQDIQSLDYLQPLARVTVGEKEYTIIQVEKSFIEGTTKLELRNY